MSAVVTETRSVVFAGVGGQGTITAANILSQVLVAHGFDVKTSEVHGMAQRGGSVTSMVRFGDVVFSPLVPLASAETIIATELLEGLRSLEFLAAGGRVIASRTRVDPLSVLQGAVKYPADAEERLLELAPGSVVVDAADIAREAGNERAANTVLLGILSATLPPDEAEWMSVIERLVKAKAVEANKAAFAAGRRLA